MSSQRTYEKHSPRDVEVQEAEEGKKGHTFSATLIAWVEADGLWEGGEADTGVRRPVYAVFGCTEGGLAPFKANLRLGRRVDVPNGATGDRATGVKGERWEFLRSAGYEQRDQRHADIGAVALQVLLPELVRIDPGMVDPDGASFVMLPTRRWASAQRLDDEAVMRHVRAMGCAKGAPDKSIKRLLPAAVASVGTLFATYLDRRTRCPIPADPRLFLQIMLAAIDERMASVDVPEDVAEAKKKQPWGWNNAVRYVEHGLANVGMLPGVAFHARHDELEKFMAHEVDRFLRKVKV